MSYLWLAAPFLVALVAWIGYKITTPAFVTGLARQVIVDLVRAAIPLFKSSPHTPEEWKIIRAKEEAKRDHTIYHPPGSVKGNWKNGPK